MNRTVYAVVAEDSFLEDFAAVFDDQTQAEVFAETISNDPDFDCGKYVVVPATLTGTMLEQTQ